MTPQTRRLFEIVSTGRVNTEEEWHEYFEGFHTELPHANDFFLFLRRFSGETNYVVLAQTVARLRAASVLDVGCGDGNLIDELLNRTPAGVRIVGIDKSAAEIDIARRRFHGETRLELVTGDVRAMPFEDGSFECAVAHQVLNFFPAIGEVLDEVCRVLQPGGTLLFMSNRALRGMDATWTKLNQAALDRIKRLFPRFVWPVMGDHRIYHDDGIREIFASRAGWDLDSMQIDSFSLSAMLTPHQVAAIYNRLYLYGTLPDKRSVVNAVEERAYELAVGGIVELILPFRMVSVRTRSARANG